MIADRPSLAFRFIFFRASRFIWSFICEYFLNTFASPLSKQLGDPLVRHATRA